MIKNMNNAELQAMLAKKFQVTVKLVRLRKQDLRQHGADPGATPGDGPEQDQDSPVDHSASADNSVSSSRVSRERNRKPRKKRSIFSPSPSPSPTRTRRSPKKRISEEESPEASAEKMLQCNFELVCQVCNENLDSLHKLQQHCCRHFMKELAEQFSGIMENMKCGLCNLVYKQKHSLLLHIGCQHGKINEILRQKGHAVLPAPIVNNGARQKEMQERLMEIKKERKMDEDDEEEDMEILFEEFEFL